MKLRVRLGVNVVALLGAMSCDRSTEADLTPARREARRLYAEAMDHAIRLQYGPAVDAMRRSLMVDPGYLPALADLWLDVAHSPRIAAVLDSIAASAADPGIARCLVRAAAYYRGVRPDQPPTPRRESTDARLCSSYVRHSQERPYDRTRDPDWALSIARLFPESPSFVTEFAYGLNTGEDREAIHAAVRAATRSRAHPLLRASMLAGLAHSLHEVGDDSGALALERAVMRDPAWALPGFRVAWATPMINHASLRRLNELVDPAALMRHVDSTVAAVTTIRLSAIEAGDQRARLAIGVAIGVEFLDRGHLEEAVQRLAASLPLVDSTSDAGWRAYVRMRLGRALVKAGRAPEAERVLLTARELGDAAGIPRVQKEIEHNLLHLYESLGRDADAQRAGEAFVRFASAGPLDPVRMMSARDVGFFLRARGRVDESRRYFDRMLADIDSLGQSSYFAGEYYEMTGALDNAMAAYTSAAGRSEEPVRALAGLVRVALATGDTAGARRWAQNHDARRDAPGRPEAAPLLPAVFRRTASGEVARRAFLNARHEVSRHGQVSAWASLTAELADLENDLGQFDRAAQLADSAGVAAKRVGAAETALRARALAAFARARSSHGRAAGPAINAIAAVAVEADRSGGVLLRAEVHRLLASALASSGQWREALPEYRRAVVPLDSVAGRIAMDPGQAAFRSAQRRAYDEALITIVRNASAPGAVAAYAAWSTRRKGRTYAIQFPVDDKGGLTPPARDTAIVDYVLLDTVVAALVVTATTSTIVPLAAQPKQIRADAAELHRAVDVRVGSSLDVRRAQFPLAVAHRLYRALLEPIEAHLSGARTLVIVPDGILSLVPFDALVTAMPTTPTDYRSAEYVLDRRVVVNATTLQTEPSAWRVATGRVTMIDPGTAPGSGPEVVAVTSALPNAAVKVLRGSEATRANTIAAMRNVNVVHFAAHADANEHDPGSSRIELSPDGGDDGRLGASEVAALRLAASLVVLSACETANGKVLEGEGVLSLSRSFLRAGARATVATLWPVGPSAAEFAGAFYSNLAQSGDAAEALRAAKLIMRSRGAPPLAWAPYQLFVAPSRGRSPAGIVATKE